jgi:3-hydroxybutyryl-CoA dehydrogenase
VKVEDIKTVAVVGTGLMGHGIAQAFVMGGYPTALYDAQPGRVDSAVEGIKNNLALFVEHEVLTKAEADKAAALLAPQRDLSEAVGSVDFVMEVVFEDVAVKKQTMIELDRVAPERTVFASNTSGLNVDEFSAGRPDRIAVAHFWNPPHILPLVEVVKGQQTSEETLELVVAVLRKIGKYPVVLRRHIPGFIGNRLQYAMFREAVGLLQSGVTTAEDIDAVVRTSLGRRYVNIGPLETADINGLALFDQISRYLFQELDASQGPQPILSETVASGNHGVKTGRGFHDWPGDKAAEALRRRDEELIRWLKIDRQRGF